MACAQRRTMARSLTPLSRARGTRHTGSWDSKVLGEANGRGARAVASALALVSFVVLTGLSAGALADAVSERLSGSRKSGSCGAFGESVGEAVWRWCYANERDNMNPCKASHREWVQQMEASCNAIREQAGCSPSALFAAEWHFHGEGAGQRLTVHRAVSRSCDGDTQAQAEAGEAQSDLDRDTRRRLQSALAAEGFDPGQPDGMFGPRTRQAVEGWQGAKGYAVTGELTGEQVEILLAAENPATGSGTTGDLHGSIAFSQLDGGGYAFAIAWNEQTADGARQSALKECERQGGGSGCRQAGWFRNACGALAIGDHNGYGTGGGETNAKAEDSALSNCRASNRNCRIEISRCIDADYQVAALKPLGPNWVIAENQPCQVFDPLPQPGETVTWSGGCVAGKASGEGRTVWRGSYGEYIYEGERRAGKQHGHGAIIWPSGSAHEGDRFEGEFRDGKLHGQGIYALANGERYEGDFVGGQLHGRGTMTLATGGRYEGQWRDNKPHGHGSYITTSGRRYEGEWRNGCFGERNGRWATFWTTAAACGFE